MPKLVPNGQEEAVKIGLMASFWLVEIGNPGRKPSDSGRLALIGRGRNSLLMKA